MQQDELKVLITSTESLMNDAIEHLHHELVKVRTGKASPSMLADLKVNYYGTPTKLSQAANISASDSRTLVIQPWDKSLIPVIERAIFEANLGVTPQNDGEIVRISIPALTEERRKDLVKKAKSLGEDAKVGIRAARHKGMESIKQAIKDGLPEDNGKRREKEIQDLTDKFSQKVDEMISNKEVDIMTI
ncbi:MAG: ribosome-recycling factor [Saprospiraceae bacterium]|nr:MAG: ribosome-recycling factor [Saprospiraceae bacterium]